MSGGHWDYDQFRVRDLAILVGDDSDAQEVVPEKTLQLVKEIGLLFSDAVHDLDWHVSGDTRIEDPEKFHTQLVGKLQALLDENK